MGINLAECSSLFPKGVYNLTKEDFYQSQENSFEKDNNKSPVSRKKLFLRIIFNFFLVIFVIFILGAGFFISKIYFFPPEKDGTQNHGLISNIINLVPEGQTFSDMDKENLNILILGMDKNWTEDNLMYTKGARTDTIMVANLNIKEKKVGLLSIPRDCLVSIPDYYDEKINAAYSLGGVELARKTVEEVLQIEIDYYILVKVNALPELIDAIGGVELYVEKDMDYDDNWGHLHIHLKEGWQTLNGDRAEQYSRFRNDEEGDLGRIRRQQQVICAVKDKVLSPALYSKIHKIIEATYKNVETDLSPGQILDLARIYKDIELENIKMATVPSYSEDIGYGSYQIIDYNLLSDYVNEYLLGVEIPVTIEILNSNDMDEIGYYLEQYLTAMGFKVLQVKDSEYSYDTSQIIIHRSDKVNTDNLSTIARLLGSPEIYSDDGMFNAPAQTDFSGEEEIYYTDGETDFSDDEEIEYADLTVIIGTDYKSPYSQRF